MRVQGEDVHQHEVMDEVIASASDGNVETTVDVSVSNRNVSSFDNPDLGSNRAQVFKVLRRERLSSSQSDLPLHS
jgi:hypothetical protein